MTRASSYKVTETSFRHSSVSPFLERIRNRSGLIFFVCVCAPASRLLLASRDTRNGDRARATCRRVLFSILVLPFFSLSSHQGGNVCVISDLPADRGRTNFQAGVAHKPSTQPRKSGARLSISFDDHGDFSQLSSASRIRKLPPRFSLFVFIWRHPFPPRRNRHRIQKCPATTKTARRRARNRGRPSRACSHRTAAAHAD